MVVVVAGKEEEDRFHLQPVLSRQGMLLVMFVGEEDRFHSAAG